MSDAATTEDVLWGWLNTVKPLFRHELHMTRVENAVGPGWPDVEGMWTGRQFFIELKCSPRPKNPDTNIRVKFQPKQPPWHKRRLQAGARIFVLVQVGSGQTDARRYLIDSKHLEVVKRGVTETVLSNMAMLNGRAKAFDIIINAAGA